MKRRMRTKQLPQVSKGYAHEIDWAHGARVQDACIIVSVENCSLRREEYVLTGFLIKTNFDWRLLNRTESKMYAGLTSFVKALNELAYYKRNR